MEDNAKNPKSETNPREKIYLGVIIGLTLLCGVLTWQVFSTKTEVQNISVAKNNAETERNEIKDELNEMLQQYDEMSTDNEQLSAEVLAQKDQIKDMLDQIEKNKGNVRLIRKYKKEVGTLRTIMKGYVVTIDSLNTLNQTLVSENTTIKGDLSQSRSKNENLQKENEELGGIVVKASLLKTFNVGFEGLKLRSNGNQSETSRANKVELFKSCFTVAENQITKPGDKDLFVRVIQPNGTVIKNTSEDTFKSAAGDDLVYSAKRTINYQNAQMDVCIYVNLDAEMAEGEYTIEIFDLGEKIGIAKLELK